MQSEKMILGVCAWIAEKFDWDVSVVRVVFALALIFGLGSPLLIYLILYFVKPN